MKFRLLSVLAVAILFTVGCTKDEPVPAPAKAFSVGPTSYVNFAPGNLQYCAAAQKFRFAPYQWSTASEIDNQSIGANSTAWIDLFGWGTGDTAYKSSEVSADYVAFSEWGKNQIDSVGTGWRTLTFDEFEYVLSQRTNATKLRGLGIVHGVRGLILLPDRWKEDAKTFVPSMEKYTANDFTTDPAKLGDSIWTVWENKGAIFLPACGQRVGRVVEGYQEVGRYWTSTENAYSNAFFVGFKGVNEYDGMRRCLGRSVRLVKNK